MALSAGSTPAPTSSAGVPSLILVERDGEYRLVRRRGRFAVERACADSPAHLAAAVQDAQERMIAALAKQGYAYVDRAPGFELRGPEPHLEFAEDTRADPGPRAAPDPRDVAAFAAWERAEQARSARKLADPADSELVDFVLVGTFKQRLPRRFTAYVPERR